MTHSLATEYAKNYCIRTLTCSSYSRKCSHMFFFLRHSALCRYYKEYPISVIMLLLLIATSSTLIGLIRFGLCPGQLPSVIDVSHFYEILQRKTVIAFMSIFIFLRRQQSFSAVECSEIYDSLGHISLIKCVFFINKSI